MNFKNVKCPKCGRRGLHHPDHAHARGWKEYSKAACRFCHARFSIRKSAPNTASSGLAATVAAKSDVDQPANR